MKPTWESGNVALYRGDCAQVMRGMSQESVDLIVTSPPYWNQREYSFWSTYTEYMESVRAWVGECARVLKPGRHCFWVIPDKLPWPPVENGTEERLYLPIYADTERTATDFGLVCEFPIVWRKLHGTQKMFGSYPYPPTIIHTPTTERICVWRKPGNADLAKKTDASKITKRQWVSWACDVWDLDPIADPNHPAPFPIEIPQRAMMLWSFVDDVVLDPFMGSGTTGVACIRQGRRFIGIEQNDKYFGVSQKRLEAELAQTRMEL